MRRLDRCAGRFDNRGNPLADRSIDIRAFLATIPFFAEVLDEADLDALAVGARRTEFDQGSVLVREHDAGQSMWAIASGTVVVSMHASGTDRRVATLRGGDIVGEMSLLTGARRAATVTAEKPVVAVEIEKAALQPILAASPVLYERFAAVVAQRRAVIERLNGAGVRPNIVPSREQLIAAMRRFFGATAR